MMAFFSFSFGDGKGKKVVPILLTLAIFGTILFAIANEGKFSAQEMRVVIATVLLLMAVFAIYLFQQRRKRMRELQWSALSLALEYSPRGQVALIPDKLERAVGYAAAGAKIPEKLERPMERLREVTVRPLIRGTFQGHSISLGEQTVSSSSGSSRQRMAYSHLLLDLDKDFPRMSIYPLSRERSMLFAKEPFASSGYRVRFREDALSNKFLSNYVILSEDQRAARAVCSRAVMKSLLRHHKYLHDRKLEYILISEHTIQLTLRKSLQKDDIESMLKLMADICGLFGKLS